MTTYAEFLAEKQQIGHQFGADPIVDLSALFPFQQHLATWACRQGRAALMADCGLGKSPMQLLWAEDVVRKTNRPVLIAAPLAVSHQVVREAEKFGVDCQRVNDGKPPASARVIVTNYERLHLFDPAEFAGMVCDESSILKNYDGTRRGEIQEFMRRMQYRLLCTATAAPNDYIELGTSAEALGEMGYMDMLARFFKNDQNSVNVNRLWDGAKWRFKHHAEQPFWRWVCSWAMACRSPKDVGFDDARFVLPPLHEVEHVVETKTRRDGFLFAMPATNLPEQREERRRTIGERCAMVEKLTRDSDSALVWCHLNEEGDALAKSIAGAVQVAGSDSDDEKEERLLAFAAGQIRVLVTKPKIGAWGLNLQHCAHVTFFPSHSYEQYYQGIRRCWRFGQQRPVRVDIITTEGERGVLDNLKRKAAAADRMFSSLVANMNASTRMQVTKTPTKEVEVPAWLQSNSA